MKKFDWEEWFENIKIPVELILTLVGWLMFIAFLSIFTEYAN